MGMCMDVRVHEAFAVHRHSDVVHVHRTDASVLAVGRVGHDALCGQTCEDACVQTCGQMWTRACCIPGLTLGRPGSRQAEIRRLSSATFSAPLMRANLGAIELLHGTLAMSDVCRQRRPAYLCTRSGRLRRSHVTGTVRLVPTARLDARFETTCREKIRL